MSALNNVMTTRPIQINYNSMPMPLVDLRQIKPIQNDYESMRIKPIETNYKPKRIKRMEIKPMQNENGPVQTANSPMQIEIEPIQIEPIQITDDYNPNLLEFNEYIKERSNLIETVHVKSVVKYHESIIDISEELNENIKVKELELDEYIKVLQNYKTSLTEISSNLTKNIDQHTQKLKEIKENNYKLPELTTIPKIGQIITTKLNEYTIEVEVKLNDNYYYKDDLIIPKTNNPYTEIYKLPCNFTKINLTNMKLLSKAEKKIALLSIEYNNEYIDLSNTDIQYFIDTFKNCMNLKEIRYPDSTEYK